MCVCVCVCVCECRQPPTGPLCGDDDGAAGGTVGQLWLQDHPGYPVLPAPQYPRPAHPSTPRPRQQLLHQLDQQQLLALLSGEINSSLCYQVRSTPRFVIR